MFTKKTDFKAMTADAIVSAYRRNVLIFWVLHFLTLAVLGFIVVSFVQKKLDLFNAIFAVILLCIVNYMIWIGRKVQLRYLTNITNKSCDPVKSEKVYRQLMKFGVNKTTCLLHIARAQYYSGKFEEALATLQSMTRPKEKTTDLMLYYSVMAGCYEELGQTDRIIEVREKIKKELNGVKENSSVMRNGKQLLTIIDGMLTFRQGSYSRSYEIYEDLYDATSFPLSRMTVLDKLAKMDQMTGAYRTAADRCEYILDACGTTFYRERAEELLERCRPKKKKETQTEED